MSVALLVRDFTDQQAEVEVEPTTTWAEVAAWAVEELDLPTAVVDTSDPMIYNLYSETTSVLLRPGDSVADGLGSEAAERLEVRIAPEMQPAGF
jgi:hypothetical protein